MRIILSLLILLTTNFYGNDGASEIYLSLSRKVDYWMPSNVDVIKVEKYQKDLSEIVSNSPSVVLRKNTQNFGLTLPSIRGFSSNQTAIIWDGVKLPKDITSTYDLSILPDIGMDKIYVLKGGWSSIFGANAEGGAIAFSSIKPKQTELEFGSVFSSFNGERYYLKNAVVKDNLSSLIWVDNYQSDGFQQNSYAFKNSLYGRVNYNSGSKGTFDLSFFAVKLKRGLPSGTPVDIKDFNGKRERQANSQTDWQMDRNLFGSVRYLFSFDEINSEISYSRSELKRDAYQFSSLTNINTYANTIAYHLKTKLLNIGFEIEESILRSNDYGNHKMKNIGYFLNKSFDIDESASVDLYARYDDSKNFDDVFSPKVILKWLASDKFLVSYSVGSSWRAPNFADIYGASVYRYDPNPDIKPEKSLSNEFTLSYSGPFKTQLSFYYYDIDDKITIYTDPNWKSKSLNLSKGYTRGLEFLSSYEIAGFNIEGGINLIDVKGKDKGEGSYKRMAYSPTKRFVGSISYSKDGLRVDFKNSYVSKQWTGQNKTGKIIPSYWLSSLSISKDVGGFKFSFDIDNLFNERYATTADNWNGYYPGNPRSYFTTISFAF